MARLADGELEVAADHDSGLARDRGDRLDRGEALCHVLYLRYLDCDDDFSLSCNASRFYRRRFRGTI